MTKLTSSAAVRRAHARLDAFLDPPDRTSGSHPLAERLESWAGLTRRHPQVIDAGVALIIFGVGLGNNLRAGRPAASLLFTALLALPLAWRRRAPITVFGFIAAAAFVQWLSHVVLFADTALFIALYGVAVARPPRALIGAFAVLEAGALLASLRWSTGGQWPVTFALLSGAVVAAAVTGVHMRARQSYVAGLLERAQRLEFERDQQAQIAAAAERARIAREMHDMVAHSLAVVISLANGATAKLRREPEQSREALESISELGRRTLDDIRQLLSMLRTEDGAPTRAPQPGIDEIDELVAQAAATGLRTSFTVHGDPAPVATGASLGAFRIVQEAITNTLKHAAGATTLDVEFTWSTRRLQISIDDDGRAAARDRDRDRPGGFGLAGMRERATLYGGSATAGPRQGGGWTVTATIPTLPPQSR